MDASCQDRLSIDPNHEPSNHNEKFSHCLYTMNGQDSFFDQYTLSSMSSFSDKRFKENVEFLILPHESRMVSKTDENLEGVNESDIENKMLIAFMKSVMSFNGDVFNALDNYKRICIGVVDELKGLSSLFFPIPSKQVKVNQVLNLMSLELSTWMLVEALCRERMYFKFRDDDNVASQDIKESELDVVNQLFNKNPTLRQAQVIIDWLEFQQKCQVGMGQCSFDFFPEHGSCRENTLHILMHKENSVKFHEHIVTELDPDGPLRQNRKLDSMDDEEEDRLLCYIFSCIKSGQLDEAYKMCIKVGQPWRASTLQGWKLFHDPNKKCLGPGGTIQKTQGNHLRDVWRMACWRLAENDKISAIERAVYASLSCHLQNLLPACKTWHEYLWAYMRVFVDQKVENHIRETLSPNRLLYALPPNFDAKLNFEEIFCEIESTTNEEIRKQCQLRFNIMQKFIILDQIEILVDCMSKWSQEDSLKPHPILLRFMTHLLLFFKSCGASFPKHMEASIISSYVGWLVEIQQVEVIAAYTSFLPEDLQVATYAQFLEGVEGTDNRKLCMELAENAGLNTKLIALTVVWNICKEVPFLEKNVFQSLLSQDVNEDDLKRIGAIEWLLMQSGWRLEAIQQSNALFRKFISFKKVQACKTLMKMIPDNSIELIIKIHGSESKHLPGYVANSIREFMCVSAYLEAQESFSQWFDHLHTSMPMKPKSSSSGKTLADKCLQDHLARSYETNLESWEKSLNNLADISLKKIKEVLCFADGGWMIDQEDEDHTSRKQEMILLRQLCLPFLFTLMQAVCSSMERFDECSQLYDLLMSEHYQLYKVFSEEELDKFSGKLMASCIGSLNKQMDPLGYSLV